MSKGCIMASESEFTSPIILVRKKIGELWMCVEYRRLNKVTSRYRLAGKTIFTRLYLKGGFFRVFIYADSVKYTFSVRPLGQYEFVRI